LGKELCRKHLTLTSTDIEAVEMLAPAFSGDEQFNLWSGYGSTMSLAEIRTDILETLDLPGGIIWQIRRTTGTLVGVAETAMLPSPSGAWIALLLIQHEFQGCGYGSEAASLLEDYLFSSPEISRVGLAVLVKNAPALTFWKKRGYVQDSHVLDNHGNDVYVFFLSRLVSYSVVTKD